MKIARLPVDADLCETSLEYACEIMFRDFKSVPCAAILSIDVVEYGTISSIYKTFSKVCGPDVKVVCSRFMETDAWLILDKHGNIVYSNGA